MKKLLVIALISMVVAGAASDAFAWYRRGYYGDYNGEYGYNNGRRCGRRCGSCEPAFQECPPPPCCEREETITVRVPPKKVCGWVCPTGANEIPASEARLVGQ